MLTCKEIKAIMAKKFRDEHCSFTEEDITVGVINGHIGIQIRGYEHIAYKLCLEKPDVEFLEPYAIATYEYMPLSADPVSKEMIGYHGSNKDFPLEEALVELAYHIAQTF